MVEILGRRRKSNPLLLGEAGVGKTAIAEGLAAAIARGLLPDGSPLPPFLVRAARSLQRAARISTLVLHAVQWSSAATTFCAACIRMVY